MGRARAHSARGGLFHPHPPAPPAGQRVLPLAGGFPAKGRQLAVPETPQPALAAAARAGVSRRRVRAHPAAFRRWQDAGPADRDRPLRLDAGAGGREIPARSRQGNGRLMGHRAERIPARRHRGSRRETRIPRQSHQPFPPPPRGARRHRPLGSRAGSARARRARPALRRRRETARRKPASFS